MISIEVETVINSFTHSLTHSLIHSFIHSLIHSLIHSQYLAEVEVHSRKDDLVEINDKEELVPI